MEYRCPWISNWRSAEMPNLWTAGHQEFRETYFYKTCREQREISVHCFRLQRDFQHEKCTDTTFGEKAWNLTAETVFLSSRWLHLWTIPDEWTSSSAFEKETSAGKSALNFFMLTIYAWTTKRRRCVDHQAAELRGPPSDGDAWTTKRRRWICSSTFFNVLTRIAITNSLTWSAWVQH